MAAMNFAIAVTSSLLLILRRSRKRALLKTAVASSTTTAVQTPNSAADDGVGAAWSQSVSLESVRMRAEQFAIDRNWMQFHTPRNILLAMVAEVGELSEIFQWRGECPRLLPGWKAQDKVHLGEELSDVLIYLVRLADRSGIDLCGAVTRKFAMNAAKYPPGLAYGSAKKYNRL
jgi:dCTP diphosphatase